MSVRSAVPLAAVLLLAAACADPAGHDLEANKNLVRRFTEVANAADWDRLPELVAEDFVRHSSATPGPPVTSRDQFIRLQQGFLASFPDQRVELEKLVAEDQWVAALATYSGTQTGPIGDFPATGRRVEGPFLALFRIESGRIAELWVEWDNLAMFNQLGLVPTAPPAQ
ncbi:MAG: ester cyclase [Acidobacteria bacterium]|nr:MAG: ester cyclase [Acidobacteriota bacterium]